MANIKRIEAKILPHSIEAEQAVLGCLMIDDQAPISIMSMLDDKDFYTEAHKIIFDIMHTIYNQNIAIDFVTVMDMLEKNNSLESVGGIDYINALTNIVPSAANFNHYVDIVKRDSVLRKLIVAGQNIIEKSYSSEDKNSAIEFAEKVVFDIAQKEDVSNLEHIDNALNKVIEKLDLIAKDKDSIKGISTGFHDLDRITNGLQNSDLILLAARPGVGKTSLAMNIINHVAIHNKKKCAIFSLEMSKVQIAQRSIFSTACVSIEKGQKGDMSIEEWKKIWTAKKQLSGADIHIDDSSLITPIEILSKCRRIKREKGLDLVMVDYLQLMNGTGSNKENRQQEISEITRRLKIAAKELDVPIIVLSQLSRAVETRKEHRPVLSDLRESGAIEQDADIVMFIYNPEMYNDVVSEDPSGVCELIVAKHRNGPLSNIKLRWINEYTKFVNLKDYYPEKKIVKNSEDFEPQLQEISPDSIENPEDLW